ncbi:hypothetical protein E2562_009518 [Oryza meyeriana var. granulata]|uniref:RING-type E3 ubiquitin transferase n=1 Tax=Oryza meyeriana var. granulata TaxID=110450 RepID=A0A6G1F5P9_9ORYZ|nr:hypothetical protein E2562_009518 [Oryza meyeriana var. granulata]
MVDLSNLEPAVAPAGKAVPFCVRSPANWSPFTGMRPAMAGAPSAFPSAHRVGPVADGRVLILGDPAVGADLRGYERTCLQACAELAFLPPGMGSVSDAMIPNATLKAAIGTWCGRSGRAVPAPPSAEAAREAVLRAMPPDAAKSVRTRRAALASSLNSSYSSPASAVLTSSYTSSSEIIPADKEVGVKPVKEATNKEVVREQVEMAVDPLEDVVVAKVMDAEEEEVVVLAVAGLREATRERAGPRRALRTPRLLAALRRVLLIPRHASACVDATAALVNLTVEPANKVRIVQAGAVPPLVEVLRSSTSPPEALEHAAGALFGLALNEDNRAAIGMLGAVPPFLDLLTSPAHLAHARRDAEWRSTTFPSPPETSPRSPASRERPRRYSPLCPAPPSGRPSEGWRSWSSTTWVPARRTAPL